MNGFEPTSPLGFMVLMLRARTERLKQDDRGASAVEWVVIAAIVVGICIAVAVIIRRALEGKANDIEHQIGNT